MSASSEPQISFIAPNPADLSPLFPGYTFDSLIATGGMGAVYCAVQKSLDRMVAIKILPQEFGQDSAFCASFEAEAKAMARLNHPNLIGVYDFGEVSGMLFIIMEFVPGKSLYHSAHGVAIDPTEVIRLVTGICNGLAHAHNSGIIHRDIKPSNILLDQNAQPKIGDFGLARRVGTKVEDGEDIFGTPHYTAPEVCGSPQSVGHRADIYSVGILLHELLTGRLPADDPRPASTIIQCDHRFDAIIRRATDSVPELRYSSAEEIARDLSAIKPKTVQRTQPTIPKATPKRSMGSRAKPVVYDKAPSSVPGIFMLLVAIIIAIWAYKQYDKTLQVQQIIIDNTSKETSGGTAKPPEKSPGLPPDKPPGRPPDKLPGRPPDKSPEQPPEQPPEPPIEQPPEPPVVIPELPKFDVDGYLTKVRKIMQDRSAAPIAAKHKANIKDNFWTFEKGVLRCVGKLNTDRVQSLARAKKAITFLAEAGGRVPENIEDSLAEIPGVPEIHTLTFEKQNSIDFMLRRDVNELAPKYIQGLGLQIERLKTDKDPAAILLIEEEIQKIRTDAEYFPGLMLSNEIPIKEKPKDEFEYPPSQ